MTVLFVLLAMAAIGAVGLAAAGRLGELPEAEPDRRPEDVNGDPKFDVVVRGYRMDEVDAVIDDLKRRLNETRL
jgi:DivIVA domain-containing protein